jgi:signal transduction histidine kinase
VRRSLFLRSLFVSAFIVLVFLVPLAILISRIADERALTSGRTDALALSPILSLTGDPRVTGAIVTVGQRALPREVSVVFPDGSVLGLGAVLDRDPIDDAGSLSRARNGEAFIRTAAKGKVVYQPVLRSNGSIAVIRVLVPDRLLQRNVRSAWAILAAIGAVLIGVAVFLNDRLARSVVRSVDRLADTANRLGSGDIDVRVEPAGPPEVRAVGTALNRLATRIEELLGTERSALADLQHQLRTPVTALRAELDTVNDRQGLQRIEVGLEELTSTLDRIIREAATTTRQGIGISTDLAETVRARTSFWRVLAEDEHRRLTVELPDQPVPVTMVESDLTSIVDVLVDNVFSHTPEGVSLVVSVQRAGENVALVVDDDGPGFPAGFDQRRGASAGGSTGLGLDIVRRLSETAGGSMTLLTRAGGGARVRVELPRAGVLGVGSPGPG